MQNNHPINIFFSNRLRSLKLSDTLHNSSKLPECIIFPESNSKILSALITVDNLWAIIIKVQLLLIRSIEFIISDSVDKFSK